MTYFDKNIKVGDPYWRVNFFSESVEVNKYINQNSNLEDAIKQTGNWFKTPEEAQAVADKFNQYLTKVKEDKYGK